MKAIKYLSILALSLFATSCMNEFDEPLFSEPPFGNNEIGAATHSIAQLKEKYNSTITGNSVQQITEDIVIEGVVVANDESGNVYKQFIINDATGAMVIGVNDVGLYAMVPKGQRVRIACKDLYIGGYGKMAQIGGLYNGKVGRMNRYIYPQHVRLIGIPDPTQEEMQPTVIDASFFTNDNKNNLAKFVRLENVSITEANGTETWAPEEKKNSSNVVERNIKIGNTKVVLRMSTYADFANDPIPTGNLNINGVMTRYNDYWQFVISNTTDIETVNE